MLEKHLISVLLVAYQQERFVREAVRSVLAQTYRPLEIILSDDCSSDRTFEIMREEAESYRGPHAIVLNRNEKNIGLVEHLNEAWGMTRGDLVVLQAGDDVSLPHRVEVLAKTWREPTPVDCVFSDAMSIDGQSRRTAASVLGPTPEFLTESLECVAKKECCYVLGCAAGYSRSLMAKYGPLDPRVIAEDCVLPFRALLNGGLRYSNEVLVKYRLHEDNLFWQKSAQRNASRRERRKWAINNAAVVSEWIRVLDMEGRVSEALREKLVTLERRHRYYVMALDVPRYMLPFLAMKGVMQGLSIRNAAGLIRRNLFHRYGD